MEIWDWIAHNSFNLLSAGGIIGSLWFTALSFRSEAKTRRIANLISVTDSHREVWKICLNSPDLARILDEKADITDRPISQREEIFMNMAIAHVGTAFYAMQDELIIKQEGLRLDVAQFISLPIPAAIWEKYKATQNHDFVAFVESCRK